MRDYSKVSARFWTGETGRSLRRLGPEAQVLALYLMTAPNSNMIGMYYLPLPTLAHELGSPLEGALETLQRVEETGFCRYDEASETVWVVSMAAHQIGESLKPADNRVQAIQKLAEEYRKCPFYAAFLAKYGSAFHLGAAQVIPCEVSPSEAPLKPLRSQEQEQEQEQEKDMAPDGAAAPRPVLSMPAQPNANPQRTELVAIVQRVFDRFITLTGKNPKQYTLGDDRLAQGVNRAKERLKVHGGDLAATEADLRKAVENMTGDEWHQTNGQLEWKFVFRSKSDFEAKLTMKPKLSKTAAPARKYRMEDLGGTAAGL